MPPWVLMVVSSAIFFKVAKGTVCSLDDESELLSAGFRNRNDRSQEWLYP